MSNNKQRVAEIKSISALSHYTGPESPLDARKWRGHRCCHSRSAHPHAPIYADEQAEEERLEGMPLCGVKMRRHGRATDIHSSLECIT